MGSIGDFETSIRQRILPSTVCLQQGKHEDTNSLLKQDGSNDMQTEHTVTSNTRYKLQTETSIPTWHFLLKFWEHCLYLKRVFWEH